MTHNVLELHVPKMISEFREPILAYLPAFNYVDTPTNSSRIT